jgi:hypothetical protein
MMAARYYINKKSITNPFRFFNLFKFKVRSCLNYALGFGPFRIIRIYEQQLSRLIQTIKAKR